MKKKYAMDSLSAIEKCFATLHNKYVMQFFVESSAQIDVVLSQTVR